MRRLDGLRYISFDNPCVTKALKRKVPLVRTSFGDSLIERSVLSHDRRSRKRSRCSVDAKRYASGPRFCQVRA